MTRMLNIATATIYVLWLVLGGLHLWPGTGAPVAPPSPAALASLAR